MRNTVLWSAIALLCFAASASAYRCLGEQGNPVDWWVVYKLPNVKAHPETQNGFAYAYADSNTPLHITGKSLATGTGALGQTLNQIYKGNGGYVMWNDNAPGGPVTSSKAHAKGLIGFNSHDGFFLRHSTPRFPNPYGKGYQGFPEEARIYGQTFLCTSLSLPELDRVAGQFLVSNVQVYDSKTLGDKYKNISSLALGESIRGGGVQEITFRTLGGSSFWDFSKSKSCDCDMWDLVAVHYKQAMYALTWGRPWDPSQCGRYPVQNIVKLSWGTVKYGNTDEHSKWGITVDQRTVCIADINRMASQKKRGGGATCFSNAPLAASFSKLIAAIESC